MRQIVFAPVTRGLIRALSEACALHTDAAIRGALVCRELANAPGRRPTMVTVRLESVSERGLVSEHRFTVNVWAPSVSCAEKLSFFLTGILRNLPDGNPIVDVDAFAGPVYVAGEKMTVSGQALERAFFTFRAHVRAHPFPLTEGVHNAQDR